MQFFFCFGSCWVLLFFVVVAIFFVFFLSKKKVSRGKLSAGALRSGAAAVTRKSALTVAVAGFAIGSNRRVGSAAEPSALANRVTLSVVARVLVGSRVSVGLWVRVGVDASGQGGPSVLVAQHAAVLSVIRAAIAFSCTIAVAEASSAERLVATHGSARGKRGTALSSNWTISISIATVVVSIRSVATVVVTAVVVAAVGSIAAVRTIAAVVVTGRVGNAVVVSVQNQRRVSQPRVVRTVSKLACSSPHASILSLACALLLNVVALVQLAVITSRAGLRIREARLTSCIGRSWSRGGDHVSIIINAWLISNRVSKAGDIIRVCVSPKSTLIKFHRCSHVHVLLPCLLGKFLSPNHGKGGPKGNGRVLALSRLGRGGSRRHTGGDSSNQTSGCRA